MGFGFLLRVFWVPLSGCFGFRGVRRVSGLGFFGG